MRPTWEDLRIRFRSVPALVWVATVTFGLLLGAWSVLVPLYEAPDEPAHVDLVVALADGRAYPAFDQRQIAPAVLADCSTFVATGRWCPTPQQPSPGSGVRHVAGDAPTKFGGPTVGQLGGSAGTSTRSNQLAQHPPLYYRAMAAVLQAERAISPWTLSMAHEVALLRLINALLIAPLPLLAWGTARRLGVGRRVAATGSLLPLVVPQLAHIGSTVNNDNGLIILAGVATWLAAAVVRGDSTRGRAVGLGVVVGAALLTKSSAFVLIPFVVVAYLAGWWRSAPDHRRASWSRWVVDLAIVGTTTVVIAGWWYLRNRMDHGTFTPTIDTRIITERLQPPGFEPSPRAWAGRFLAWVPARTFGWFGWFSARQSFRLLVLAAAATVTLVVTGLAWPRSRQERRDGEDHGRGRPTSRLDLAVILIPGLALLGFVIVRAWGLYVRSGQFPFLQGRYFFPGVVGAAVVVAAGLHRWSSRWAPAVVLAWASVIQVNAIGTVLHTYWGPVGGGISTQVGAVIAWSRWPGLLLALGAVLLILSVIALAGAVGWQVHRGGVDPAPPGSTRRVARRPREGPAESLDVVPDGHHRTRT
ncbi:MAG: DUF2142 domain-containing protein [Aquihabitans sp.]